MVVILSVSCIAVSFALSIFCSSGSLIAIIIFFSSLYMPYLAISLGSFGASGLGGVKNPSV